MFLYHSSHEVLCGDDYKWSSGDHEYLKQIQWSEQHDETIQTPGRDPSDEPPRQIWGASRGATTHKYVFPPRQSLSLLQSNTNSHVRVHTGASPYKNPSRGHLANSLLVRTPDNSVSHLNISCWGWSVNAFKPFLYNGNVWSCLQTYFLFKRRNAPKPFLAHFPLSSGSNHIPGTIKAKCSLVMNCFYRRLLVYFLRLFVLELCWAGVLRVHKGKAAVLAAEPSRKTSRLLTDVSRN